VTPRRIELLGVPVDCVTMSQSVDFVEERVASEDGCAAVVAVNPEKIMRARVDPALLESLRRASLLIPDGIGAVWGARLLANAEIGRVPGAELMPAICGRAAETGFSVFLFGAQEEVNAKAAEILPTRFPGLQIAGRRNGYVDADAMPCLIDEINQSGADVLFIALGSPRQEEWIDRYIGSLRVKAIQGVGGTFDVIAGRVQRAPAVFRRLNLEWFYRLLREPKRLWRQRVLLFFALAIIAERLKLKTD
jgi:N-acetylglucosaminyldiphosphoundecaprenol N-acetyl-beta-D-mannosaminyltransferase